MTAARGWVLIDAGLPGTNGLIKSAAAERFGSDARPVSIIITHGHFDHVGALEHLADEWDSTVYAHPLELPYLNGRASYPPGDASVGGGLMAALARPYARGPVNVGPRLQPFPEDGTIPGMPGWRHVHTPGHSVGHTSLWRDADRTLIVGDAFVTTAQESTYAVAVQRPEMHGAADVLHGGMGQGRDVGGGNSPSWSRRPSSEGTASRCEAWRCGTRSIGSRATSTRSRSRGTAGTSDPGRGRGRQRVLRP